MNASKICEEIARVTPFNVRLERRYDPDCYEFVPGDDATDMMMCVWPESRVYVGSLKALPVGGWVDHFFRLKRDGDEMAHQSGGSHASY